MGWVCNDLSTLKLFTFAGVVCIWLAVFYYGPRHLFAEAANPVPGELPSAFTSTQTLSKLRSLLCGRCSHHAQNRLKQICRDYGRKDVCYWLCGCSNYDKKCLAEGICTCPFNIEEGCSRSQTLCVFDDALICSTPKDICVYYDERKTHCECRGGWTGENCQTCGDGSINCEVDDKSSETPSSGSDLTIKVLVIACVVCLILGLLLGIFCMCRTGKLVCITTTRINEHVEEKDETEGRRQPNPPVTRQQSEHRYCPIIQYAVPDHYPTASSHPALDKASDRGYTEPNTTHHQQSNTRHGRDQGNYYFKLESASPIVTYESVPPGMEKNSNSAATSLTESKDELTQFDVITKELDQSPGNSESKFNACQSNQYDHLKRQMDVNISDKSRNYSHIALQEFL
ncbi:uncharacterized protein LOC110989625 [Acanthaster planci]|uniref:Uncharacterized protein LOC110989625 n=1 Tax=Acanthaster planci TaxID=133434 RepID=A0A8B7ZYL3_ACAPL|nr:uncharacterized protein LOC110989625 [Acanthaster planci]